MDAPLSSRLFSALLLLTLATGMVDGASILGLGHVFTANMTGNVVFLGFSFVGAGRVATSACLIALGAFLAGARVGGQLAARGGRFRTALFCEAALLAIAALVAFLTGDLPSGRVADIALLASAMGLQNAGVRKLGVMDMTTTVLTLTITGLAADSASTGGASRPHTGRRLASVALMLLGGTIGAALWKIGVRWTIGAAALVVGVAAASAETVPAKLPLEGGTARAAVAGARGT